MILYFGTMLSRHGKSPALMELVVPRLAKFKVIGAYSNKRSQVLRLVEMVFMLWRFRNVCTIVFIDTFSTTAFWYCYILAFMCKWLRIPYLPVLHGGLFERRLNQTPKLCHHVFAHAAVNISPSLFLKNIFERRDFKVKYLPNFIELEKYHFLKRSYFKPTLLWVRAFHEIYNPAMAVEVVHLLKNRFPDVSLTMVGADKDGSLAKVKELSGFLGIQERIKYTGYLPKEDWINLAVHSDFFLNTSTADNMPVSVIEGMALGLIVISTNVGGIPYLLDDSVDSCLVENNDAKAMAKKIEAILDNPIAGERISSSARKKIENFSWDVIRKQWLTVIQEFERKI